MDINNDCKKYGRYYCCKNKKECNEADLCDGGPCKKNKDVSIAKKIHPILLKKNVSQKSFYRPDKKWWKDNDFYNIEKMKDYARRFNIMWVLKDCSDYGRYYCCKNKEECNIVCKTQQS